MRADIYSSVPAPQGDYVAPRPDGEPGELPGPYGEVPGSVGPSPDVPGRRRTPPVRSRRRRSRRSAGDRPKIALFVLLLCLVLGTAASGAAWRWTQAGWVPGSEGSFPYPWQEGGESALARAPVGDGTTLDFTLPVGDALSAQEVYERVSPSVVGVRARVDEGLALGTGIVMTSDGYIITNAHVIAGSRQVTVVFSDDSQEEALLVGEDTENDLAVLKIEADGLQAAQFGDSGFLRVGDVAYAIGNPLGEELRGTMTDGMISALERQVSVDGYSMTLIQTTAPINSGNSGGALVNCYGQVVGITNMKMMSPWNTIEGLGFAIPTAQVKQVVNQLIELGYYPGRPMLGVTVSSQKAQGDIPAGALVEDVDRNSDAYAQGIRQGHVITAAEGNPISGPEDLRSAIGGKQVGDTLRLTVWNQRNTRELTVKLVGSGELG